MLLDVIAIVSPKYAIVLVIAIVCNGTMLEF